METQLPGQKLCVHCNTLFQGSHQFCSILCYKKFKKIQKKERKRDREVRDIIIEISEVSDLDIVSDPNDNFMESSDLELVSNSNFNDHSVDSDNIQVGRKRKITLSEKEREKITKFLNGDEEEVQQYSGSELKHMNTSGNCFLKFLDEIGYTLEDLKGTTLKTKLALQWVQICLEDDLGVEGFRPMLKVTGFRDTYIPHFIKWLKFHNIGFEDTLRAQMVKKVNNMVRLKHVRDEQLPNKSRKAPVLTLWDLSYIISVTPPSYRYYLEMMSWLTLSLYSGQRGITLINLKDSDITVRKVSGSPGNFEVTFTYRRGKNNYSWNHRQVIEGNPYEKSTNPLFWLNRLILQNRGIENHHQKLFWDMETMDEFVFQSGDSIDLEFRENSEFFQIQIARMATFCGYPAGYFGNHSTRRGCIQSILFLFEKRKHNLSKSSYELLELYIGYSVKSKAMETYITDTFKSIIRVAKILDLSSEITENNVSSDFSLLSNIMVEPKEFHNLTSLTPSWLPQDSKYIFWEAVHCVFQDSEHNSVEGYFQNRVINHFTRKFELPQGERSHFWSWFSKYIEYFWLEKGKSPWVTALNMFRSEDIEKILESAKTYVPSGPLKRARKMPKRPSERSSYEKLVTEKVLKEKEQAKKIRIGQLKDMKRKQERELARKASQGQRIPWSQEETSELCNKFLELGPSWAKIVQDNQIIGHKTNIQAKDRMRNVQEQLKCKTPKEAAQKWLAKNQ